MQSLADILEKHIIAGLEITEQDEEYSHLRRIMDETKVFVIPLGDKVVDLRQVSSNPARGAQDIMRMLGYTPREWERLREPEKREITERLRKQIAEKIAIVKNRLVGELVLARLNYAWEYTGRRFVIQNKAGEIYSVVFGPQVIPWEVTFQQDLTFRIESKTTRPTYSITLYVLHPNLSVGLEGQIGPGATSLKDAVEIGANRLRREIGEGDGTPPPKGIALYVLLLTTFQSDMRDILIDALKELTNAGEGKFHRSYSETKVDRVGENVALHWIGNYIHLLPHLLCNEDGTVGRSFAVQFKATVEFNINKADTLQLTVSTTVNLGKKISAPPSVAAAEATKAVTMKLNNNTTEDVVGNILEKLRRFLQETTKVVKNNTPCGALIALSSIGILESVAVSVVHDKVKDEIVTAFRHHGVFVSPQQVTINFSYIIRERNAEERITLFIDADIKRLYRLQFVVEVSEPKVSAAKSSVQVYTSDVTITVYGSYPTDDRSSLQFAKVENPPLSFSFVITNNMADQLTTGQFTKDFMHFVTECIGWFLLQKGSSFLEGLVVGLQQSGGEQK